MRSPPPPKGGTYGSTLVKVQWTTRTRIGERESTIGIATAIHPGYNPVMGEDAGVEFIIAQLRRLSEVKEGPVVLKAKVYDDLAAWYVTHGRPMPDFFERGAE